MNAFKHHFSFNSALKLFLHFGQHTRADFDPLIQWYPQCGQSRDLLSPVTMFSPLHAVEQWIHFPEIYSLA
jgi:hypothetical protein